jgi:hypothetical protein
MGADKNSCRRRLKVQQDELARSDPQNTRFALLPSVCQNNVATEVLLVLGTNTTSSLNSYMHTAAETTRKPAVWRGRLDRVWGRLDRLHQATKKSSKNTSADHKNAPWFHQQNSLVKAKQATRKFWRKPKLHPGALGWLDRLLGVV